MKPGLRYGTAVPEGPDMEALTFNTSLADRRHGVPLDGTLPALSAGEGEKAAGLARND